MKPVIICNRMITGFFIYKNNHERMKPMNDNPFGSWPPSDSSGNLFGSSAFPDLGSEVTATNPFDPPPAPSLDAGAATQSSQVQSAQETQTAPATPPPAEGTQLQLDGMSQTPPTDQPVANPLAAVMGLQAEPGADNTYILPPIFEHGSVTEDITDLEQTFDQLRAAKADDFPELEDEKRVTWEITYGKVRRSVYGSDAKKKKIGEFKASIEKSKDFKDVLAKSKDKKTRCVLKPRVTAQSKGERMPIPAYKGVFADEEAAAASGKVITIVPGRDGHVYRHGRLVDQSAGNV